MDPDLYRYLEYGSGSTKLLNADPIWIQIHKTVVDPIGSRQDILDIIEGAGYQRFDHRNDFNEFTQTHQNDLFVRKDIVAKYNVIQL